MESMADGCGRRIARTGFHDGQCGLAGAGAGRTCAASCSAGSLPWFRSGSRRIEAPRKHTPPTKVPSVVHEADRTVSEAT